MPLPLHIFEPRYKEMIGECLEQRKAFGLVRAQKNSLAEVGCYAIIQSVLQKYEDGRMDIATEGQQRFEILRLDQERSFLRGEVMFFNDEPEEAPEEAVGAIVKLHEQFCEVIGQKAEIEPENPLLSFYLANELPVDLDFRQALLEMKSEAERIHTLIEYYRATIPKVEKTLRAREKAGGNGHVY